MRARYKRARPTTKDAAFAFTGRAGLSKLSSVRENNVEVDVILGELNSRTESKLSINGFNAYRNEFPDSLERR